jgi:hypothetical protein
MGLECFFDLHQIDGGANFPDVIDRALRDSRAVLCCWSPRYFQGQWSMIECRDAIARGLIVPVAVERFEQFAPPADLRQINWFDLVEWQGEDGHEDWNRTLLNLGKLVGRDLGKPFRKAAGGVPPAPITPLEELRTTWATFPARSDLGAVERFLERARAVVAGSGFELEVEHHLDGLRQAAERRAQNAARAEQERKKQQAAAEEARQRALEARQQPGAVWRDMIPGMPEETVPEMVTIQTGSPDCVIAYPLALSRDPVTFADMDAAIAVGADLDWPSDDGLGRDQHPVVNVTWHDATAYLAWLNGRLGLTGQADAYRLPGECEWDYACEGQAGGSPVLAVGKLCEWCSDPWQPGDDSTRVVRAGPESADAGPKSRDGLKADARRGDLGFRLARKLSR